MEHIINQEITQSSPTVITLGNFDGIHLGPQGFNRHNKTVC